MATKKVRNDLIKTPLKISIKKLHPDAVIPSYAKAGDAGMDLTAISSEYDMSNNCMSYGTGLAFEIPEGHVGLLFPRSSIYKQDVNLSNAVGVLDSGYRGEVLFKFKMLRRKEHATKIYKVGERIGQIIIMPYPKVEFNVVEALSETSRGIGGFGHTGK